MSRPAVRTAQDERFDRVLVIHHRSGIGDLIWHLPYLRAIAAHTAGGRVTVMARPSCRATDILAGEPAVEEVIEYDYRPRAAEGRQGRHTGPGGLLSICGEVRRRRFSHVFIFSSRVRYGLIALLAGIPHRAGFGFGAVERLLLNDRRFIARHAGAGSWVYPEATAFAVAHGFVQGPVVPRMHVPAAIRDNAAAELAGLPSPCVALAIGTSEPRKDWGAENFARLAAALVRTGYGVVLLGGPGERETAGRIVALAGVHGTSIRPICQSSVLKSAGVLACCRLCAGNDTGILNVAAACEVPALGLFGATRPLSHDPLLTGIEAPGMAAIAVEQVVERVNAMLDRRTVDSAGSGE